MRQTVGWLRDAFSDLRMEIEDMVAEGDKVVASVTFSGRHEGQLMGIPATGRASRSSTSTLSRGRRQAARALGEPG